MPDEAKDNMHLNGAGKFPGKNFPKISFVIPCLNSEKKLEICLKSIAKQIYPKELIEIIVVDGGSTDGTVSVAKKYDPIIINNPERYQEPGKALGFEKTSGEYVFFVDSDNELADDSWIINMIQPFLDYPEVECVFASCKYKNDMSPVNKYISIFADPFSYFVFKGANITVNTENDFKEFYKIITSNKNYIIYEFNIKNFPVLALTQGTALKKTFVRKKEYQNDDILPVIQIIESGAKFAYVKNTATYHFSAERFSEYIDKLHWRIKNSIHKKFSDSGIASRENFISPNRKNRMYLFIPYALSIIFPFFDSLKQFLKLRETTVFYHIYTSFMIAILIIKEYFIKILGIKKTIGDYGR